MRRHLGVTPPLDAAFPRDNHARVGHENNTSVFGKILRGELPAKVLYEDDLVLVFRDIAPASTHHSLVIPKRLIRDCNHIVSEDVQLVRHMEACAKKAVAVDYPDIDVAAALSTNELSLGFHRWPMLSVPHLHLHCIYPVPCKRWWHRIMFPQHYGMFYSPSSDFPPTAPSPPT